MSCTVLRIRNVSLSTQIAHSTGSVSTLAATDVVVGGQRDAPRSTT